MAKGSIPILRNIEMKVFDECAQLVASIIKKPNSLAPSFLSSSNDIVSFILETRIQDYWENNLTAAEVVEHLTKELIAVQ